MVNSAWKSPELQLNRQEGLINHLEQVSDAPLCRHSSLWGGVNALMVTGHSSLLPKQTGKGAGYLDAHHPYSWCMPKILVRGGPGGLGVRNLAQ